MRLMFIFAVLTALCVVGIDRLTNGSYASLDQRQHELGLVRIQTNNGPFYYRD